MSLNSELDCRAIVELITDYLEGRMDLEQRLAFEEHLSTCSGCREYLDQMRTTVGMLGTLEEWNLPADVQSALVGVFRSWKRK